MAPSLGPARPRAGEGAGLLSGPQDAGGGATEGRTGPVLELVDLERRFGDTVAVDGLSLRLREGELVTLLGPSGCGKTTVLRLVAGFETPDAGRVRFRGRDVTSWSPRRRGFGMVFQNYALFPHLDVFENVAFGLRSRDRPEEEIRDRVARALELVDLPGLQERQVQALSGGQQQRVAVARALAIEPPLLLLDEPLSNLDAALRERTRTELRLLVKELGITTLFVTHDQEEAFDLSDRVAVMERGRIRQTGAPEELYDAPADPFVAGFVGRANRLPVRVEQRHGRRVAVLGDGTAWALPEGMDAPAASSDSPAAGSEPASGAPERASGRRAATGEGLELWIRPEDLEIVTGSAAVSGSSVAPAPDADSACDPAFDGLAVTVRDRRFRGAVTLYRAETSTGSVVEVAGARDAAAVGDRVVVRPRPDARMHLFPTSGSTAGAPSPTAGAPGPTADPTRSPESRSSDGSAGDRPEPSRD